MPAQLIQASVVESNPMEPHLHWLRFRAPDMGRTLKPGQFVTLLDPDRLEPYLPTPLFPTHIAADEIGCLFRAGDRERWLGSLHPGDTLQVAGPLGHPFDFHAHVQSLLLVSEGLDGLALLPVAQEAIARGVEVSFLAWSPVSRADLPPPGLLPSSVEYGSAVGVEALTEALPPTLAWAGQVCATGSRELLRVLLHGIQSARLGYPDNFCQVLLQEDMMCSLGLCGQCRTRLKRGTAHLCTEGPVFDLKEVV